MPYPVNTFPTFNDLLTYINTFWITNGMEEITGVIGNDVVNGLLTFVEKSPLNWNKAKIESTGGIVSVSRPISVFMTNTPTSLSWPDNIYNEYVFINTTANNIPLAAGFSYYDINLSPVTNVRAKSRLNIVKANNNLWIQRDGGAGDGTSGILPFDIAKKVDGQPGSPIAGLTTYQNDDLINASGVVAIIVNNGNENIEDGNFTFDSTTGTIDRSPNVWVGAGGGYTGDSLIMYFTKNIAPPIVPVNPSIQVEFTNETELDIPWTNELILLRGKGGKFDVYEDDGNGSFILTFVPVTTDSLTNPTNYHFNFGGPTTGVIVF